MSLVNDCISLAPQALNHSHVSTVILVGGKTTDQPCSSFQYLTIHTPSVCSLQLTTVYGTNLLPVTQCVQVRYKCNHLSAVSVHTNPFSQDLYQPGLGQSDSSIAAGYSLISRAGCFTYSPAFLHGTSILHTSDSVASMIYSLVTSPLVHIPSLTSSLD